MATLVAGGEKECRRPRIDTPYKTLKNLLATHSAGEREGETREGWRDGGRLPGCSHCVVQSRSFVINSECAERGMGPRLRGLEAEPRNLRPELAAAPREGSVGLRLAGA